MIIKDKLAIKQYVSAPAFDANQYKNVQRQQWDKVADGWKQWWPLFEQGAQPLSDRLVTLANLHSGQRVLDVATGIGEPALTAVQQVGSTGYVTAIDQSPYMLAIAQKRAADLGMSNIKFLEMDAESLDLPPNSFDAILSRFGLMFLPNLDDALVGMRQLLLPGGHFATAVWDVPSKVPMLSLPMRVARQHLHLPPPPAGVPNPFNLADAAAFEQRLHQAGFEDVYSERIKLTWDFASADEFVQMTRALAAPITALLENHSPERQADVWDAITEAVQQYASGNGRITIPSEAICVVGRRR